MQGIALTFLVCFSFCVTHIVAVSSFRLGTILIWERCSVKSGLDGQQMCHCGQSHVTAPYWQSIIARMSTTRYTEDNSEGWNKKRKRLYAAVTLAHFGLLCGRTI